MGSLDGSYEMVDGVDPDDTVQFLDSSVLASFAPYFNSISNPNEPLPSASYEHITRVREARDARPDGRLFIDELLTLMDIEGPSVYPLTSAAALNSLLLRLLTSAEGLLKAHCVIFYLILAETAANDAPATASTDSTSAYASSTPSLFKSVNSTRESYQLAKQFADKHMLPTGFRKGVEGFFALDTENWDRAISCLTDPHFTPDFIDKTLNVLSLLPPVPKRASLVLSYWRLTGIETETESQVGLLLDALCDQTRKYGVIQAWTMQRNWKIENEKDGLARRILSRCFGDNPTATPVSHHLQSLLAQPFTATEDELSREFCLKPPQTLKPTCAALAADWRISKYIAEVRPIEALTFGRQVERKGLRGGEERSRLLRVVRETLTEVQKNMVDLEAEAATTSSPVKRGASENQTGKNSVVTNSTNSTTKTSQITHPAWRPRSPQAPTPLPQSLLDLRRPVPVTSAPTASDLPLSASPFLRQERPLVATSNASTLGGAQKSLLRAARDGTSKKGGTSSLFTNDEHVMVTSFATNTSNLPDKGKAKASTPLFGFSTAYYPASSSLPQQYFPSPSSRNNNGSILGSQRDDLSVRGSPAPQPPLFTRDGKEAPYDSRKPTLAGFGSVRIPQLSLTYREDGSDDEDENENENESMGKREPDSFALRAARDPVIAAAIAQASKQPPSSSTLVVNTKTPVKEINGVTTTPSTMKRRKFSSSAHSSRKNNGTTSDKRRAISTEPDDQKPTSSVKVTHAREEDDGPSRGSSGRSLPPGAFPGMSDNEVDNDHAQEQQLTSTKKGGRGGKDVSKTSTTTTTASDKTPARKKVGRAGSAPPSTPRPKRASSVQPAEEATVESTPRTGTTIRRSSRLQTPAKDKKESVNQESKSTIARKKAGTAQKSSREMVIEE